MDKKDVIAFFNAFAPTWDENQQVNPRIVENILDNAQVAPGQDVLDVACGTGVMFPFYLKREVNSITAIDISREMVKIAQEKFREEPRVQVFLGDVEEWDFGRKFDRIVVYNAFPHFPNPQRLIKRLAGLLKEDGRLTIAHGASRAAIDDHHKGSASKVSNGLMSAESLTKLLAPYLEPEVTLSTDWMYQVSGVNRGEKAPVRQEDADQQELLALLQYMADHNDAHAQELTELADRLLASGNPKAARALQSAIGTFDMANAELTSVLRMLR